jgi:hypothetical protein
MIQQLGSKGTCLLDQPRQAEVDEIAARVNAELGNSPYHAVRRVQCVFRDGKLILHGRVPSYFLKQIAQMVVCRGSNGAVRIVNQLQVVTEL